MPRMNLNDIALFNEFAESKVLNLIKPFMDGIHSYKNYSGDKAITEFFHDTLFLIANANIEAKDEVPQLYGKHILKIDFKVAMDKIIEKLDEIANHQSFTQKEKLQKFKIPLNTSIKNFLFDW